MTNPDVHSDSRTHVTKQWPGRFDFLTVILCGAIGLGNLIQFPYLAYKNGGGAFFIPYFFCSFCIGFPIFLVEIAIGQYSSKGPLFCWDFCPIMAGCGILMVFVTFITCVFYNSFIAWAVIFFLDSFSDDLPWMKCGYWSTKYCIDNVVIVTEDECVQHNRFPLLNGLCINNIKNDSLDWIWNLRAARRHGIYVNYPAFEYFTRGFLGLRNHNQNKLGSVRLQLVLGHVLAFILLWISSVRGLSHFIKVLMACLVYPYILLTILLSKGLTLEGSIDGITSYLIPDLDSVMSSAIWKDAAIQTLYSITVGSGVLITQASYNKFHYDLIRDTFLVPIIDCLTSMYAGLVIFTYVGFLAKNLTMNVDEVFKPGPGMAFEVFPFLLTKLPYSTYWCINFFLMVIILGITSECVLVHTVLSSLVDLKPELRGKKVETVSILIFVMFVLSIPLMTPGGIHVIAILNEFIGGYCLMIIGLCECLSIGWLYGGKRLFHDIETMTGNKYFSGYLQLGKTIQMWWIQCWKYITPILIMTLMIWSVITGNDDKVLWMIILGWIIMIISIGILGFTALYQMMKESGTWLERWKVLTRPSPDWKSSLQEQLLLEYKLHEPLTCAPEASETKASRLEPRDPILIDEYVAQSSTE